jgi:predicted O-methyltransferase YrrM
MGSLAILIGGAAGLAALVGAPQTGGFGLYLAVAAIFVGFAGFLLVLTGIGWSSHKTMKRLSDIDTKVASAREELESLKASRASGDWSEADVRALRGEIAEQLSWVLLKLETVQSKLQEAIDAEASPSDSEHTSTPKDEEREPTAQFAATKADEEKFNDKIERSDTDSRASGESTATLDALMARIEHIDTDSITHTERLLQEMQNEAERTRVTIRQQSRQVQSWLSVYGFLNPPSILPSPDGFAIAPDLAAYLIRLIINTRPECVIELGSGLSTIIMGLALDRSSSGRLAALESDARFKDRTERLADEFGLRRIVDVELCQMRDVCVNDETYRWYDTRNWANIQPIDLLFVDGPSGSGSSMARYPAVPLLIDYMRPGGLIVVDDVKRNDERKAVECWLRDYNIDVAEEPRHLHGTVVFKVKDVLA